MPTVARALMQRNVLTIPATMPVLEIQHLFVVAGIDGAPVIDEHGAVLGVISTIDLLRVADQALDEDFDEGEGAEPEAALGVMTAREIATPDPVWVPPEMPADRVAELMQRERIQRVLVGTGGHLEGILSAFDLLRAVRA